MAASVERFEKSKPKSNDDPFVGYELAPIRGERSLPGEVVLRPTRPTALDALVADLLAQAISCARTFGDFHIALGGDATIEALFLRLMSDPDLRAFPWDRTHVWLTHEWAVAGESESKLFALVNELLIGHADLPSSQAHAMGTSGAEAAEDYERQIARALAPRPAGRDRLDCVVVVIEPDGFAGGRAMLEAESGHGASGDRAGSQAPKSLALRRSVLNASRVVALVGLGADRREAIAQAAAHRERLTLAPVAGELRWYLDHAAAGVEGED